MALLLSFVVCQGQTQTLSIGYRAGSHEYLPAYGENEGRLLRFCGEISPGAFVRVVGYSSPEGDVGLNDRLSQLRGEKALQLLRTRGIDGTCSSGGEDWQGLRRLVEDNYFRPDRAALLELLSVGMTSEMRKRHLRAFAGGDVWTLLLEEYMPLLRYARCEAVLPVERQEPLATTLPVAFPAPVVSRLDAERQPPVRKTLLALKSNLLYDALTLLNLSVEVPFSRGRFSAVAEHQFAWWRCGAWRNKYCLRYLQSGGEVRWWFSPRHTFVGRRILRRDALCGHFFGLYGMGGKYDFEWRRSICYQGEFWSAGLSYGYSLALSRHLNMEFSLCVGYAAIDYRHFVPAEDYSVLYRDRRDCGRWHYFGPTKLAVSLVFPIGKRGGER